MKLQACTEVPVFPNSPFRALESGDQNLGKAKKNFHNAPYNNKGLVSFKGAGMNNNQWLFWFSGGHGSFHM